MNARLFAPAFASAVVLSVAAAARAEVPAGYAIGDAAKDFALTCAVSGKEFKLADHKGKVVVVNFINRNCPVSLEYDERLAAFAAEYKDKGVVFVHIDSVAGDRNTVEAVKEHAVEKKLNAPVLKDTGNKVADQFGARVTPHVFVLDKEGKLAYKGSFDDGKGEGHKNVSKHYVKDAVDALLAGKAVEVKETKPFGCGIKRAS
jgi:peroxiredoxin